MKHTLRKYSFTIFCAARLRAQLGIQKYQTVSAGGPRRAADGDVTAQ
jgi:hypothetical protein